MHTAVYSKESEAMKNLILMLVFTVLLSGCQTMGNKTGAQLESDRVTYLFNKSNSDTLLCHGEISKTTPYKVVYSDIFFEKDDSPNKYDLLSSNKKLTINQKESLKEYLVLQNKCRQAKLEPLNGLPHQIVSMQYNNSMDEVYLKLFKDEITIGQANEAKVKIAMEYRMNWTKETAELNARLQESHNQEVGNAQRRAQILMPYLMQQQLIQQQQQQNNYQQQIQQINNNRTINTRCNTYGNTTNCTTR